MKTPGVFDYYIMWIDFHHLSNTLKKLCETEWRLWKQHTKRAVLIGFPCVWKVYDEWKRRMEEAAMLERHIMQAQARAMSADERDIHRSSRSCKQYDDLGLPPGEYISLTGWGFWLSCFCFQICVRYCKLSAHPLCLFPSHPLCVSLCLCLCLTCSLSLSLWVSLKKLILKTHYFSTIVS